MHKIPKNWSLVIALAIPVIMVGAIGLSIMIPRLNNHPSVDFIYSINDGYVDNLRVVDTHIVSQPIQTPPDFFYKSSDSQEPHIFYYSMSTDESTEITLVEAQKYTVSGTLKSSEGFEVVHGSYGDFPFGGSDYNAVYLKKGAYSKRLNTSSDNSYGINFLGWVNK